MYRVRSPGGDGGMRLPSVFCAPEPSIVTIRSSGPVGGSPIVSTLSQKADQAEFVGVGGVEGIGHPH